MKKNQWINEWSWQTNICHNLTWYFKTHEQHQINHHTVITLLQFVTTTYLHTRLNQHAHIACMEPLELQQHNIKYQTRFCPRVSKRSSNSWQWVDMTSMRSARDNALAIACSTCEFLNSLMGKHKKSYSDTIVVFIHPDHPLYVDTGVSVTVTVINYIHYT